MKNHKDSPLAGVGTFIGECVDSVMDGLQETSKGVSRGIEKVVELVQDALDVKNPMTDVPARKPSPRKPAPKAQAKKASAKPQAQKNPSPNPQKAPVQQVPAELLEKMEHAIHRAYHMEGGFRFYAGKLCRYIELILPGKTDLQAMHIAAYNSCIEPILWQVARLEASLEDLRAQREGDLPAPGNQPLLEAMRRFAARAEEERLSTPEGWEAEAYRDALIRYGADLRQVLDAWPPAEDS